MHQQKKMVTTLANVTTVLVRQCRRSITSFEGGSTLSIGSYTHTHTHTHIHAYVYTCTNQYVCLYIYIYMYMSQSLLHCINSICICAYIMYVLEWRCVYVCMYVCTYMYMCVYMCVYICMYVCTYMYICVFMCIYKHVNASIDTSLV